MKRILLLMSVALFIWGCSEDPAADLDDLKSLPADEGGTHDPFQLGATSAPYGFYVYKPSGYTDSGPKYPLLIFLHGSGERGNSSTDATVLDKILINGIAKFIDRDKWDPTYPMLVVSPQCHDGGWQGQKVHDLITYIIDNYQVNPERIYINGLSMGGFGTFNYIETMGEESYAAAVVPICGGGNKNKGDKYLDTPVWAFHGDADNVVSVNKSKEMVQAINNAGASPAALLTIYPGIKHNSWTMTYDASGMGQESSDFDPFNMTIWDWMFQYKKK